MMADPKKTRTTAPERKKAPAAKVATKAARSSEMMAEKTAAVSAAPEPSEKPSVSAVTAPEPSPSLFPAPKADAKPDPIADAVARAAAPALRPTHAAVEASAVTVAATTEIALPATRLLEVGAEQARDAYARARATTANLREAITESANATTRGALEVNGKVIKAWQAQNDATFEALQSALRATTLSDVIRAQTSGARQVYETAATHWRDVAESTTRWFGTAVKPIQSALMKND
jgi:hypothetical protein